jgi:hypothetical protein
MEIACLKKELPLSSRDNLGGLCTYIIITDRVCSAGKVSNRTRIGFDSDAHGSIMMSLGAHLVVSEVLAVGTN